MFSLRIEMTLIGKKIESPYLMGYKNDFKFSIIHYELPLE